MKILDVMIYPGVQSNLVVVDTETEEIVTLEPLWAQNILKKIGQIVEENQIEEVTFGGPYVNKYFIDKVKDNIPSNVEVKMREK